MIHDHSESLMVVLLQEMIQHNLPRMLAIREKMRHGEVISTQELVFMKQVVLRINDCFDRFSDDPECRIIFSTLAHLASRVVTRAYENEPQLPASSDQLMVVALSA